MGCCRTSVQEDLVDGGGGRAAPGPGLDLLLVVASLDPLADVVRHVKPHLQELEQHFGSALIEQAIHERVLQYRLHQRPSDFRTDGGASSLTYVL